MAWWNQRALRLQRIVRNDEAKQLKDYSEEDVRQANVHIREDMVILSSLLSSANTLLSRIFWTLVVIALILAISKL